jgi:transcriptional regulator with XRE-family HTH domain
MPAYDITRYDPRREEDIKAEARVSAFFALRQAWKDRSSTTTLKAQDLAEALGKDKGYVSRVLSGKVRTITLETLAVFLEALGYHLSLDPVRIEDLPRANRDVRPSQELESAIARQPARAVVAFFDGARGQEERATLSGKIEQRPVDWLNRDQNVPPLGTRYAKPKGLRAEEPVRQLADQ